MLILLLFLCRNFLIASHCIFSAIQLHFFQHPPIAISNHSKINKIIINVLLIKWVISEIQLLKNMAVMLKMGF